tara:strand:- start:271 stop:1335 length:1065 start_codon:yes stop_codon:yes gene_type:complete
MKTILVTGGTGYIGSHICVSLKSSNYRVIVVDSNVNSSEQSLDGVKKIINQKNLNSNDLNFYKGDLRDQKFLKHLFSEAYEKGYPIEGVIHLAGLKSVEESTKNPILYWDNNLCGTINLLKVMNLFDCKTIVFSSSATIYGNSEISPLKESFEIKPCNPYGQTKASIELILESIFNNSKNSWRIANLRYFNPIGAHESGLIGEDPLNKPNNLFPYICLVASGKYEKLNIFGKNWPTHDGTGVRDYIHVMDLADAHKSSLKFLINKKPQIITLNVGTGIGTSVLELVNTFEKVNNCKIKYNFCERRPGDVSVLIAENKKAISLLNWEPKRDIKQMCRDGWKWSFLNPHGYEKIKN